MGNINGTDTDTNDTIGMIPNCWAHTNTDCSKPSQLSIDTDTDTDTPKTADTAGVIGLYLVTTLCITRYP